MRTRLGIKFKRRLDPEYIYSVDANCPVMENVTSLFLPLPPPLSFELPAAFVASPITPSPTARATFAIDWELFSGAHQARRAFCVSYINYCFLLENGAASLAIGLIAY